MRLHHGLVHRFGGNHGFPVIAQHGPMSGRRPIFIQRPADLKFVDPNLGKLSVTDRLKTRFDDPLAADIFEQVDEARSRALGFFRDFDAILCPASFALARPHQASHADSFDDWGYVQIHNLLGWPGASVRAGTSAGGLPVGVQLIAAPWREDIALALAQEVEELMGGFQPPDL